MEADALSIIHDAMSMVPIVSAFGREEHELSRFRRQGNATLRARVGITTRQTLFSLSVNMTTATGTALVLGFGSYQALRGRLTPGDLLVVLAYVAAVYKPLEAISYTVGSLQDNLVGLRMAFHILDTEPIIQEVAGRRGPPRSGWPGHVRRRVVQLSRPLRHAEAHLL